MKKQDAPHRREEVPVRSSETGFERCLLLLAPVINPVHIHVFNFCSFSSALDAGYLIVWRGQPSTCAAATTLVRLPENGSFS